MASVLVCSLPRTFYSLSKNFTHVARSNGGHALVFSEGGNTLHFAFKRRSLHLVSCHGGLTEFRSGFDKAFTKQKELAGLGRRGNVRGVCFYKNEKSPEDIGSNKDIKRSDWPILERWDIPWDWQTTLAAIMASGLSYLLTGLAVTAAVSYIGIRQGRLMSLDERATLLFIDQFLITAVGLALINAFINRYKPLPNDLFYFDWKEPLNLYNGWFLWGVIGLILAVIGVALAGVALTVLNGETPPRETDSLMQLLPLIGASNVSTASLVGVTGILAPLYEETVFRGYLMTSLTKWFPTPVAVILSASAFALAHLTPGEFPQLFTLGTVLGFSYAQTRNLLTPITIHAFWNSGVVVFLTFLQLQGYNIQDLLQ